VRVSFGWSIARPRSWPQTSALPGSILNHFSAGVFCVFVCVWVCSHTHIHTHNALEVLICESVGCYETLENPKNPDWLNFRIHISIYVHKVRMYIYMFCWWDQSLGLAYFFLWTYFPFRKRKSQKCDCHTENLNPHEFELQRPSINDALLLFKVINAITIISVHGHRRTQASPFQCPHFAWVCLDNHLILCIEFVLVKFNSSWLWPENPYPRAVSSRYQSSFVEVHLGYDHGQWSKQYVRIFGPKLVD